MPDGAFVGEGLEGRTLNQLAAPQVRRLAAAQGICLLGIRSAGGVPPTVVAGGDERPLTAELTAAAVEGLRASGCRVVDLGGVTAGCLVWAARQVRADGALLVGNCAGRPHAVSVRLWGADGEPWSAAGTLDKVRAVYDAGSPRPVRRSGPWERWHAEPSYLAERRERFYALRPLTVVLDTASVPLVRQLTEVLAATGVRLRLLERPAAAEPAPGAPAAPRGYVERRLDWIARQVRRQRADLGAWVDGDGQVCQVLDDRGQRLSSSELAALLSAVDSSPDHSDPARVSSGPSALCLPPSAIDPASRQAAYRQMLAQPAAVAADGAGRIWFGQSVPTVDALLTLGALLTRLSQSDAPLGALR